MAFITAPVTLSVRASSAFVAPHPERLPAARRRQRTCRMLVVEAGGTDDMDKILTSAGDSLVVVDYGTSWCGPCRVIAPLFEELSEKHTDVVFVKVMGDLNSQTSELMKREGIRAVPAFHFWKSKERVKDFSGARAEELESSIGELK